MSDDYWSDSAKAERKRNRKDRRARRREKAAEVWDSLGFSVDAGPVSIEKEPKKKGKRKNNRGSTGMDMGGVSYGMDPLTVGLIVAAGAGLAYVAGRK